MKEKKERIYTEVESAASNLDCAIDKVESIKQSRHLYYYTVKIPYTHHFKVSAFGFRTKWTWKTEPRFKDKVMFDSTNFQLDIIKADVQVRSKRTKLQEKIKELERVFDEEISAINRQRVPVEAEKLRLSNDIKNLKAQIDNTDRVSNGISSDIWKEDQVLSKLASETSRLQAVIENIQNQISNANTSHSSNVGRISELQSKLVALENETENADGQVNDLITSYVTSLSKTQRSDLLIRMWFEQGKDAKTDILVKSIIKQGFDAAYFNQHGHDLASIAIVHKDEQLFELVLEQGSKINFELQIIKGSTLLEYCIKNDLDFFANRILETSSDFSRTMLRALKSNDLEILDKILTIHPELASTLHQGHSYFQLAVIDGKIDIVRMLLKIDKTLIDQENFKGENAFKLALRSGNNEMIKELLGYVDLNTQIQKLADESEIDLLTTLFESAPELVDKIDSRVLHEAIQSKNSDLATMLLDYGTNLSSVLKTIFADGQKELLLELYKLDPDYLANCAIGRKLLSDKVQEYGYESIMRDLVVTDADSTLVQGMDSVTTVPGLSGSAGQYSDHAYGEANLAY